MKTAIKTEFICVKPRSSEATDRFVNKMDRLHSCKVEKREYGKVYLSSISGKAVKNRKDQSPSDTSYRSQI